MAKNLKLNIKNEQIAKSLNLSGIKSKLAKKKASLQEEEEKSAAAKKLAAKTEEAEAAKGEATAILDKPQRQVRARTKSSFTPEEGEVEKAIEAPPPEQPPVVEEAPAAPVVVEAKEEAAKPTLEEPPAPPPLEAPVAVTKAPEKPTPAAYKPPKKPRLGPTGRHINDILPPKPVKPPVKKTTAATGSKTAADKGKKEPFTGRVGGPPKPGGAVGGRAKQYRDLKPASRLGQPSSRFDARDRQGLRAGEEERWRKRRPKKARRQEFEESTIRPAELDIRLPISVKDLAEEMKRKASQLVQKLFMQGMVVTLNDVLDDETTVQLLGEEFQCKINIDTSEEERIRITEKSIREEIESADEDELSLRPPVITFMGHVDHGKTSLIDAIRSSNVTAGEAGAITQHIGAFRVKTEHGDIAILDTPGHEAFSAMRARGAEVTDIVVLVIAGDEGMRQQTEEALQHAKAAGVTIVAAINKSDKPGFDPETVYRQLAEHDLTPEAWGGQTVTINTSATTKEGVKELLEMLALQAEVLELRAQPKARARGTVLESEMSKGRGNVATLLVQNGTLKKGDSVVFGRSWGRVKTIHNDQGKLIKEAGPCTPLEITGLSSLPEAGEEFIVVANEKEARSIAEAREEEARKEALLKRTTSAMSLESMLQASEDGQKKVLNIILRADVQGSAEALKTALQKIASSKAEVNIIFTGVGEVTESDVQLAAASKAMILGFHTQVETHAEQLIKETGVQVKTHDIIYHAIDDVRELMAELLDEVAEERETGKAQVRATFKSSALGIIAGCLVTEGTVNRNNYARLVRGGKQIWKGKLASLKRNADDAKEVQKGFECGIVLDSYKTPQEDDIIETYEIVYIKQEL